MFGSDSQDRVFVILKSQNRVYSPVFGVSGKVSCDFFGSPKVATSLRSIAYDRIFATPIMLIC